MSELENAVRNNDIESVRCLLEGGADVHARSGIALKRASEKGYVEIVRLLIEAGADVHVDNDYALKWASYGGHLDVVRVLLEAGANVRANASIALELSSEQGHTEVVRVLLEAGADVHSEGDTPIRIAAENGYTEVVRLLLQAGANVHSEDDYPIRYAAENGHTEVVRLLLEAGADVSDGYALDSALENGHLEIVALLREFPESRDRERRRAALEQERKNEQLRAIAIDEVKNREEKVSENPFIDAHCSSTDSLYGDPLKDTDDIVVFELDGNKGDCYLKEELKLLRSDQYVRGVGEKAYKLPWSNVWITKTLKEFSQRMEGYGPLRLRKSEDIVGYNRNNFLWILEE